MLAGVEFAIDPELEDIEPFMGSWSATAPHPAYRDEQTRREHDRVRAYDTTWYQGMLTHPPDATTGLVARVRGDVPVERGEPEFYLGRRVGRGPITVLMSCRTSCPVRDAIVACVDS